MDEENESILLERFESDKLIIGYLVERQNQLDSYYDAQNSKISQILTINGVIFGVIILVLDNIVKGYLIGVVLFYLGIFLLFLSTILSIIAYRSFSYCSGFPRNLKNLSDFVYNVDNISSNERLKKLKGMIIKSLDQNLKSLDKKVSLFNRSLILQYFSIGSLFIGYILIIFYKL